MACVTTTRIMPIRISSLYYRSKVWHVLFPTTAPRQEIIVTISTYIIWRPIFFAHIWLIEVEFIKMSKFFGHQAFDRIPLLRINFRDEFTTNVTIIVDVLTFLHISLTIEYSVQHKKSKIAGFYSMFLSLLVVEFFSSLLLMCPQIPKNA